MSERHPEWCEKHQMDSTMCPCNQETWTREEAEKAAAEDLEGEQRLDLEVKDHKAEIDRLVDGLVEKVDPNK